MRHLAALGFTNVHNECVDFYDVLEAGELPPHDVVVTNPPYSGNHVEMLLRFAGMHDKPYLMLMPNHVCLKPFFFPLLSPNGGSIMPSGKWCPNPISPSTDADSSSSPGRSGAGPVFVCPRKRYYYWTPKAMRPQDKHGHCNSILGQRTSPFISFWYVDLEPTVSRRELLQYADQQAWLAQEARRAEKGDFRTGGGGRETADSAAKDRPIPAYCKEVSELPKSAQPSLVLP